MRWLRYTPALFGTLLLYFLLPLYPTSGPIFLDTIEKVTSPCERFWWRNLLYLNNWYDVTGNVSIDSVLRAMISTIEVSI